jgi:hypothetical protein
MADGAVKKRGKRLWKILGALVVLFGLLVLALPWIAAPIVRSKVEAALEEQLAVDADIRELKLGLGGTLHLAGLRLTDQEGRVVTDLARIDASIQPLQALRGTYAFDVVVDGLEAHVFEEEDGSWSVNHLPRETRAKPPEEEPESAPRSFDLRGEARLTNVRVIIVRRDQSTLSTAIEAQAGFRGPSEAARLGLTLELESSGKMTADATLPGDPGAWGRLDELDAAGSLQFSPPLDLAAVAPLLSPFLPLDLRAGTLGGSGSVKLAPGLDLQAEAGFQIEQLELQGPRPGAPPLKLARVTFEASTKTGPDGAPAPHLALRADDALALEIDSSLRGAGSPAARLDGKLSLDGDVGKLAHLSEGWFAFREGLELAGSLVGSGTFYVALRDQALGEAGGELSLDLRDVAGRDAVRGPIDLGTLGQAKLTAEARYDGAVMEVPAFTLAAGPLRAEGATALGGLDGDKPVLRATRLDAQANLDELAQALDNLIDLGEAKLAGTFEAHVEAAGGDPAGSALPLSASVKTRGLVFGADATEYGDLNASLQGLYDGTAGTLTLDTLELATQGLSARGKAALAGLSRATGLPDVELDLAVDADPSDLPGWVRTVLGEKRIAGNEVRALVRGGLRAEALDLAVDLSGRDVALTLPGVLEFRAGSLRNALHASGPLNALALKGEGEFQVFDLKLEGAPPAEPGAAPGRPIAVSEPLFAYALDTTLVRPSLDVDLRKLHLESRTLSGDLKGRLSGLATLAGAAPKPDVHVDNLAGDFVYVPDKLAQALGPFLPGELTGVEPEACKFLLNGHVQGLDTSALVAGLTGTLDLGVGRYRNAGLDVGGDLHVDFQGGKATLSGDLAANGGTLKLAGELGVTPGSKGLSTENPHIKIGATDVQANSGLAPLLGYVHPAFSGLDTLEQSAIGGLIDCEVDLSYQGMLDAAALAGGWEALPKEPIQGTITFALDGGTVRGSPLVSELLSKLELGSKTDFVLKPISMQVRDGRIHYDKPWEWTLLGSATTFGGSIGLDHSLDLQWTIPISAELAAKNELLQRLQGQSVSASIGGTVTRPKVSMADLAGDLVKGAVKSEIEDALESVTGSADGKGTGPGDLLARADELWKKGDKAAAAALYKELREKHKVSLVYALNKDRIKERADWKP